MGLFLFFGFFSVVAFILNVKYGSMVFMLTHVHGPNNHEFNIGHLIFCVIFFNIFILNGVFGVLMLINILHTHMNYEIIQKLLEKKVF